MSDANVPDGYYHQSGRIGNQQLDARGQTPLQPRDLMSPVTLASWVEQFLRQLLLPKTKIYSLTYRDIQRCSLVRLLIGETFITSLQLAIKKLPPTRYILHSNSRTSMALEPMNSTAWIFAAEKEHLVKTTC